MFKKKIRMSLRDGNEYKTNAFGDEEYQKQYGVEVYIKNAENFEVMAKKRNSNGDLTPYFAMDADGNPICPYVSTDMTCLELNIPYPKNSSNKELYPKRYNKEFYISFNRKCKYAKDEQKNDYFAVDKKNFPYYAFQLDALGNIVEFPAFDKNGASIYIMDDEILKYPYNLTIRMPIFPLDSKGNEQYIKINSKQYVAHSETGSPIYIKNNNNDEILPSDNKKKYYGFKLSEGKKRQYYPKLQNKHQYYLEEDKRKIYAKDEALNEIYARTKDRDQYLADDNNVPYYATNHNGIETYPSTRIRNNFYKIVANIELIAINKITQIGFYARDAFSNEIYPRRFTNETKLKNEPPKQIVKPSFDEILLHSASSD